MIDSDRSHWVHSEYIYYWYMIIITFMRTIENTHFSIVFCYCNASIVALREAAVYVWTYNSSRPQSGLLDGLSDFFGWLLLMIKNDKFYIYFISIWRGYGGEPPINSALLLQFIYVIVAVIIEKVIFYYYYYYYWL